ncbi:flagellar basal body-associated FliL family protein [Roseibacterium sp. SDUM158016]|uniref:flagellar basal body-associated FliL family protein n=1 Tax=Roseicyclus sediminis TaxID=2980997 RepID=UPI0021CF06A0|nr:flagellar basal body-associated FliL family protein [Roseibacterium sp. SDUM158016]MCU4654319.1 flagellar basal body-associated FliL family protein [Roseibacterium sp. SDUM158016]
MSERDPSSDKSKRSVRGRVVMFALPALALVAAGAAAYLHFFSVADDMSHQSVDADASVEEGIEIAAAEGMAEELTLVPLREIIVNISATTASGVRAQRFLKLNLAIAYDEGVEGAGRVLERQPYIRDAFVDYLRLLNESDLSGSAGLARLRSELLHRARSLAETDAPRELLVVDLVIQ